MLFVESGGSSSSSVLLTVSLNTCEGIFGAVGVGRLYMRTLTVIMREALEVMLFLLTELFPGIEVN